MRKQKKEGNLFDKILKENADAIFRPLIERVLGSKITSSKPLPEKIQTTIEREADILQLITTEDKREMILHVEFQTKGNKEMVYRLSEYHGIELRKYKLEIKHIVIYLGKGKTRMKTQLNNNEIFRGFELFNVHDLNTDTLISSQIPAEIILAILSDYPKERSEGVIRLLLKKLKTVCKNDNDLRKYVQQLIVLSKLRNLDLLTNQIVRTMPITYDITKDSFYLEGMERGMEKGMEKGIEKGVKEERERMTKEGVKNMLKEGIEIKLISTILNVTQKYVKQIQKEMEKN